MITTLDTPYVNFNSVVGVNKQIEMSAYRHFAKIRASVSLKFDLSEETLLASFDKGLGQNFMLRVSSKQSYKEQLDLSNGSLISLNFFKKF